MKLEFLKAIHEKRKGEWEIRTGNGNENIILVVKFFLLSQNRTLVSPVNFLIDLQQKMLHKKRSLSLLIPQDTSNLLLFAKEIFNRKHLMCSGSIYSLSRIFFLEIFAKS